MIILPNSFGLHAKCLELKLINGDCSPQIDPWFICGSASNSIIDQKIQGVCLKPASSNIDVISENSNQVIIRVGGALEWQRLILHCLKNKWHGLENLVDIPGSVGAAPVQNIGAYGCEIEKYVQSIQATYIPTGKSQIFSKQDCKFSYRTSIFKREFTNHLITHVFLKLSKIYKPIINHKDLFECEKFTPQQMVNYISKIRSQKLPDPKLIGNAGSFFKNPIIKKGSLELPSEIMTFAVDPDNIKISAASLIDLAGLKDKSIGGAKISSQHALVIVNNGNATFQDVKNLCSEVQATIMDIYGIKLEPEVRFIDKSTLMQNQVQMA